MSQSKRQLSEDSPLDRHVANALAQLEQAGYSDRSLNRYGAIWKHFIEFSRQNKMGDQFSEDLAARFVEVYRIRDEEVETPGEGWRRHIVFGLKVLGDFVRHGCIKRPIPDTQKIQLPRAMKDALRNYEQYCKERLQLSPSTLQRRIGQLKIFLDFLNSRRARTLDQIQAVDLSDFVSSQAHLRPKTVSRIVSDVRSFLRFLTVRGILKRDLALPKVRVPSDAYIPSVWDRELVSKLLRAVDRSSAKGRRDYAILLMACRLGLRAGDIRTLKLDDLNWEESRIEITQSKTATPLSLPLTEEVGEALIDYVKSGRPKTAHREVFLKLQPPFGPFTRNNNLYYIVTYWRGAAGIRFRTEQRCGMHSLRHTLATRLLEVGTPFQTISAVLGHISLQSTRIYAKADVETLRSVALDPEEVTHVE